MYFMRDGFSSFTGLSDDLNCGAIILHIFSLMALEKGCLDEQVASAEAHIAVVRLASFSISFNLISFLLLKSFMPWGYSWNRLTYLMIVSSGKWTNCFCEPSPESEHWICCLKEGKTVGQRVKEGMVNQMGMRAKEHFMTANLSFLGLIYSLASLHYTIQLLSNKYRLKWKVNATFISLCDWMKNSARPLTVEIYD